MGETQVGQETAMKSGAHPAPRCRGREDSTDRRGEAGQTFRKAGTDYISKDKWGQ